MPEELLHRDQPGGLRSENDCASGLKAEQKGGRVSGRDGALSFAKGERPAELKSLH